MAGKLPARLPATAQLGSRSQRPPAHHYLCLRILLPATLGHAWVTPGRYSLHTQIRSIWYTLSHVLQDVPDEHTQDAAHIQCAGRVVTLDWRVPVEPGKVSLKASTSRRQVWHVGNAMGVMQCHVRGRDCKSQPGLCGFKGRAGACFILPGPDAP